MATHLTSPSKESHADKPAKANKIVEVWKGLMLKMRLETPIQKRMSSVDFSSLLCFLYHSLRTKPRHFLEWGKGMDGGKRSGRFIPVFAVLIVAVHLLSACAPRRTLVQISEYKPHFSKDWNQYKGKSICLMNFDNQANDTSIWYYYSTDQKLYYGADSSIHNYFWYAFYDAFANAGISVSSVDHPDLTAPAMWVTLRSITDERYTIRVRVQKKGASTLSKNYSIEEALPADADRSPPVMAPRAYRMTNRLIETVMGDPEFQTVIIQP